MEEMLYFISRGKNRFDLHEIAREREAFYMKTGTNPKQSFSTCAPWAAHSVLVSFNS